MPDERDAPRERVLRQLVEALLSERLVPIVRRPQALDASRRHFEFKLGEHRYTARGRTGAFGRVRLEPDSVTRVGPAPERVDFREIGERLPAPASVRDEILEELAATERLCAWNQEHLTRAGSRAELSYAELEGSLVEGHPYHPCFKARTGFSLEDHERYGPEAKQTLSLAWFAVRRAALTQTLPCAEPDFWARELGDETFGELQRALAAAGMAFAEFGLMPCHPWQAARWRALAPDVPQSVLALDVRSGSYRATQSLRTLMNAADPRAADVKLPLATRISSSLRVFEPECVRAAPAISEWLARTVASDAFFTDVQPLTILREYASSCLSRAGARSGHLGVMFRESVSGALAESEAGVPFNAVFARELDGRPLVDAWVTRHGLMRWLKRLLRVSVLPLFRLLVHHGIALEAHAQNLILVHRGGYPERLLVRDFHDSVEYVERFLAAPERAPDFGALDSRFQKAPVDRYYWMSSLEELRELFADTLFVFNLSELANLLFEHYDLAEERFWAAVRSVLDEYPLAAGDLARLRALNLDAPRVRVESLFERRLHGAAESRFHHLVDNPLHEPRKERHVRPRADANDQ